MNITKLHLAVALALALLCLCEAQNASRKQEGRVPDSSWFDTPRFLNRPHAGYVGNKTTAIVIGKAILTEVYGPSVVAKDGPFDAKRFGDVWIVYSFVPKSPDLVGGGYTVEISATTGTILNTTLDQ